MDDTTTTVAAVGRREQRSDGGGGGYGQPPTPDEARAALARVAATMEATPPEAYKEKMLAHLLDRREASIERIGLSAAASDAEVAAAEGITEEEAARHMARFRTGTPEEIFDGWIASLEATPADELLARERAQLAQAMAQLSAG